MPRPPEADTSAEVVAEGMPRLSEAPGHTKRASARWADVFLADPSPPQTIAKHLPRASDAPLGNDARHAIPTESLRQDTGGGSARAGVVPAPTCSGPDSCATPAAAPSTSPTDSALANITLREAPQLEGIIPHHPCAEHAVETHTTRPLPSGQGRRLMPFVGAQQALPPTDRPTGRQADRPTDRRTD